MRKHTRALTHGRLHFYGAWLGTVEGTNPFLSLTFAIMRCGIKKGKALEFSTIGLLLSFLFIRVLSLPSCFAFSSYAHDETGVRLPSADSSFLDNDLYFYHLGRFTILFLWVLSTWWFSKMVRGVLKRDKAKAQARPANTKAE